MNNPKQKEQHPINITNMNQNLIEAKYANRGAIVDKANEVKKEMLAGKQYPFKEFTLTNSGNPHTFGQPPITYYRQVLASVMSPELIERGVFSDDVTSRAKDYLKEIKSIGAYSDTSGVASVRRHVADFIEQRDGVKADPENILLCNGASEAIALTLNLLNNGPDTGFLVSIPIYPLYSAFIDLHNNHLVGYYLDEHKGWGLNFEEIETSLTDAQENGIDVKAIVIINPGNPTGAIFSEDDIKDLCNFAYKHKLAIMADEVYQENIYNPEKKFISVRKVLSTMQPEIRDSVTVFSYHSVSKGVMGECGIRGGYVECYNVDPDVMVQFRKYKSFSICSNVTGQLMVDLMVRPPTLDYATQETVDEYQKERDELLASLKRRATNCYNALKVMKGIEITPIDGALYAFPKMNLPEKFVEEARELGIEPDLHYCYKVLEKIGLVIVPGSGFKQKPGTHHFRTTILPLPEEKFNAAFNALRDVNDEIMEQYK